MSERCGGESTEIMGYNTIVNFNVLRYSECHGTETKRQRCELAECANHFSIQTSKSYLGHMKKYTSANLENQKCPLVSS